MAEVTYYYHHYDNIVMEWTDPGNAVDGDEGTYAYEITDHHRIYLDWNSCSGIDLGTISKVEVRALLLGDGDDEFVFRDKENEENTEAVVAPSEKGWSTYADITPWVESWDWGAVNNYYLECLYDKSGKANQMNLYKVEIRVTYTPPGGYYHGLKVEAEGELALCDVGTNPLRIRKGSTTYGIELVDTSDPNASAVRIQTSSGTKAIRRYT